MAQFVFEEIKNVIRKLFDRRGFLNNVLFFFTFFSDNYNGKIRCRAWAKNIIQNSRALIHEGSGYTRILIKISTKAYNATTK